MKGLNYFFILISFIISNYFLHAQINSYDFSSTMGNFSEITGGTVLWSGEFDDEVSSAITIPDFKFNNKTYSSIYISANGYITFGQAPSQYTYTPISSSESYDGAISAFGTDMQSSNIGTPEVRYQQIGNEFVIQWKDVRRFAIDGERISFQIRLNFSNNTITIVYGNPIIAGTSDSHPQVGLRGETNSDFNNRQTTSDWTATTSGSTNDAVCVFNSSVYPADGLTFIWSPVNMTFISATTEQVTTSYTFAGENNQEIIRLHITTRGTNNPINILSITFTTSGTTSTDDISKARVFYTTSPVFSTTQQYGSELNNPAGEFTITATQTLIGGENYFWLVYDINNNATRDNYVDATCESFMTDESGQLNRIPDVTDPPGNRQIKIRLNGIVTVGTNGDFSSLTGSNGLFNEINTLGLGGKLIAQIISDLSEDGSVALNEFTGTDTLFIVPASPEVKNIVGNYNGGLIRMNGADRIVIDGSYSGSGKYLHFKNSANSGEIATIHIIGPNANNIKIKNCIISCGYQGTSTSNSYAIYIGGSYLGTSSSSQYSAPNNYIDIEGSTIKTAKYGVFINALSTSYSDNISIFKNEIGSENSSEYIYHRGISINYLQNGEIYGNHIFNIITTLQFPMGIFLNTSNNCNIYNNKIHSLNTTANNGSIGIYLSACSYTQIFNNVIYNILGLPTSINNTIAGIRVFLTSSNNIKIYFNTIYLSGTVYRNSTNTVTTAIHLQGSNFDVRNNIFINTLDNTARSDDKNYAIYSSVGASGYTEIDYNYYYSQGPQNILGYLAGVGNIQTIESWRAATGKDVNSSSNNPQLVSDTDLRPVIGSPVLGAGTPISGITTDFLGDPRNATSPSIGAYENPFIPSTPPNCPVLISPANASTGVSVQPTLQWSDGGGGTTGYKLYFGTDNPPTNIHNGTDLGNVTSYTFSSNLNYLTTYYWRIVSYNNNGDASGCEVRSFTTVADPALLPSHVTFDPAEFPPFGWTANPSSGTGAWKRSTSGTFPTTTPKSGAGMGFFNSFSYSSGTSGLLISPQINFPDENFRVYFWMYRDGDYSTNADRLDIYVSTTTDTLNGTRIGTVNRSTDLPPSVSGDGWYFYEFNLPTGTSGNRYIIVCGRSNEGNNIYIDELGISAIPAATNTQTISAGNTDPITFTGTGTTIQFTTANTDPVDLSVERINSSPGGSLPDGLINLAPVYWNIDVTSGTVNGTYSITFDVSDVPGVNNPSLLRLLKRANPNEPWTNLGTPNNVNGNLVTWTGLTSFSDFGFGGDDNNPLPVQLASFVATTKGRDVILNWTTATEVNTAGFEIERKLVSQEKAQAKWENVGFVRGNGNSNRPIEYTFTDTKLNTGKYAYRLKMIDNDGSYEYSDEVQVEIGKPDVTKIEQNYPNAFNPATKIEYQLANPSKVVIEVYNITGEKIAELVNSEQVEGYYSLVFDASKYGLASGIYFYRMIAMDRVTGKNVVQTKKMLYLK